MKLIASILALTCITNAYAEHMISIYGGLQTASDSTADVTDVDGSSYSLDIDWEGRSFSTPPYYGIRYTNYAWKDYGFALDFVHSKVYASQDTLDNSGYNVMEFTDGINVLTAIALKRFDPIGKMRPYVGAGLGINMPHVELESPLMSEKTFEYQYGGMSAIGLAGVNYALTDHWGLFTEARFDYSQLDVEMGETGNYKTELFTQAINLGISYSF